MHACVPQQINPYLTRDTGVSCFERQLCHLINVVINTVISLNTLLLGASAKLS